MKKLLSRNRPSPAMAIALAALFVALGGSAIAAAPLITGKQIKDRSIFGRDIARSTLRGAHVKDGSLRPRDFSGSVQGPPGAQGPAGPEGPAGPQGPAGPRGERGPSDAWATPWSGEVVELLADGQTEHVLANRPVIDGDYVIQANVRIRNEDPDHAASAECWVWDTAGRGSARGSVHIAPNGAAMVPLLLPMKVRRPMNRAYDLQLACKSETVGVGELYADSFWIVATQVGTLHGVTETP